MKKSRYTNKLLDGSKQIKGLKLWENFSELSISDFFLYFFVHFHKKVKESYILIKITVG
jgi:hypothetical protein